MCRKWIALRADLADVERHRGGILVQDAFVDRHAKPYLSAAERELFISAVCGDCWPLLCPSDPLAYC